MLLNDRPGDREDDGDGDGDPDRGPEERGHCRETAHDPSDREHAGIREDPVHRPVATTERLLVGTTEGPALLPQFTSWLTAHAYKDDSLQLALKGAPCPPTSAHLEGGLSREHGSVTGEEILKGLAEERLREVERTAPEHRQSVMLQARPFLTGAFIALARANAFAGRPTLDYLEELLAPIEQPLVDEGVVERVSFGFEVSTSAIVIREDESER